MNRNSSSRRSLAAALGWPKAKSRNASSRGTPPMTLQGSSQSPPTSSHRVQLLPVPPETCILLKILVDFLVQNKLHKEDLFLLDAKPNERRKLLSSIEMGEIPEKLSQFSSRSVSRVVLELLTDSYAPLLPLECATELTRLDRAGSSSNRINCVARSMRYGMLTQQSQLLESLLLLLYKLSLKATPQMNAAVLGDVVGAKLVGSASNDSGMRVTQEADEARMGRFLIANAPDIIQRYRGQLDAYDASAFEQQVHVLAPHHHQYQAATSSLRSAAAIILGRNQSDEDNTTEESERLDKQHTRKPLNAQVAANLSVVLMAVINSKKGKLGLYVGRSRSTEETEASVSQVQNLLVRSEIDATELLDADPVTLSLALRGFLLQYIQSLLSHSVGSLPARNQITDAVDDSQIVRLLEDTIAHELATPTQDVLLLILASVRQALDAGTDHTALERNLEPCLLPSSEDPKAQSLVSSCVAVLFSEMHLVVQSLLEERGRYTNSKKLSACVWAVYWGLKLRRRAEQRRHNRQFRSTLKVEMVHSLSRGVEWLIDQTQVNPSQLRRLYLEGEDNDQVAILIDKLSEQRSNVNLALFSPFSIAAAIQKILMSTSPSLAEAAALSTRVEHLKQLLESHFGLLMKHEPLKTVRDQLRQRVDEMLYGKATKESSEHSSDDGDDHSIVKLDESPETVSFVRVRALDCAGSSAQAAATLSEWLYLQQLETHSHDGPSQQPPHGYSTPALSAILDRLGGVLFVVNHSRKHPTDDSDDDLVSLLDYLGLNAVLIPRKRARATLHRIQNTNRSNKILEASILLRTLEFVETLAVETVITLRHPAFAALYPSMEDQLTVLFDVWGLADRAVTSESLAGF